MNKKLYRCSTYKNKKLNHIIDSVLRDNILVELDVIRNAVI